MAVDSNKTRSSTNVLSFFMNELNCKDAGKLDASLLDVVLSNDISFLKLAKDTYGLKRDFVMECFSSFMVERDNLKQDFTPPSFASCVAKLAVDRFELEGREILSCYDCCCGSGALSLALFEFNKDIVFYMEELDTTVLPFLLFNLMLRGVNADVINGDVLKNEFYKVYKIRRNGEFSQVKELDPSGYSIPACDVSISNPPFNLHFKDSCDYSSYGGYKQTAMADPLFFIRCIEQTNEQGKAFIIEFPGFNYRQNNVSAFRKWMVESNTLDSVIILPEKSFINTSISTALYVLDKKKSNNEFAFISNKEQNYHEKLYDTFKNGTFGGAAHMNRVYKKSHNGLDFGNILVLSDAVNYHKTYLREYMNVFTLEDMRKNGDFEDDYSFSPFIPEKQPEPKKKKTNTDWLNKPIKRKKGAGKKCD